MSCKNNKGKRISPTIEFDDGPILVELSNAELAAKLGLKTTASRHHYDLIVVGGRPAGLMAGLYTAREGLDALGRPCTHQVTEINGNFNTWDLAQSFEQADPRYQSAVVVQYAELLRHSPWAAETSASQLVEHAYRFSSLLWDDTERSHRVRQSGQSGQPD